MTCAGELGAVGKWRRRRRRLWGAVPRRDRFSRADEGMKNIRKYSEEKKLTSEKFEMRKKFFPSKSSMPRNLFGKKKFFNFECRIRRAYGGGGDDGGL